MFLLFVIYTALGTAVTGYVAWRKLAEILEERSDSNGGRRRRVPALSDDSESFQGGTLPRTASATGIELEDVPPPSSSDEGGGRRSFLGVSPPKFATARASPARDNSSEPLRRSTHSSYGSPAHLGSDVEHDG